MNKIALVLLNLGTLPTTEFTNCDVYSDIEYISDLTFLKKLNLIGISIRKYELNRDSKYDKIVTIDCSYYSIHTLDSNWFMDTFGNMNISQKELYTDEVLHMLYPIECTISFKLMCMDSIPFNFVSNFIRFYNAMNKHLKSNSEENLLYAYTYMSKIKVYNLDNNVITKLIKLI